MSPLALVISFTSWSSRSRSVTPPCILLFYFQVYVSLDVLPWRVAVACYSPPALFVLCSVADDTYIGTIAGLASKENKTATTMYIEVRRFVYAIAAISLTMSAILAIIGFSRKQPWQGVLINAFISVIVANVPQGLPATVTSMLGVACSQLSKKQVYVKRSEIVESLGSASVICSDKTGTLTLNLMRCVLVCGGHGGIVPHPGVFS